MLAAEYDYDTKLMKLEAFDIDMITKMTGLSHEEIEDLN